MKVRNTFIIFIVSGFWHGANWTFIVWGALNAIYFLPLLLMKRNRQNIGDIAEGRLIPSFREFFGMATTFSLTLLAWVFFRAENIGHALSYIAGIFSTSLFEMPDFGFGMKPMLAILLTIAFVFIEWLGRHEEFALASLGVNWKRPLRHTLYYSLILIIIFFGGNQQEFIYFQF